MLDVTIDVFEHNDGVIDKSRKRQRQPAQNHAVNRAVSRIEHEEHNHDREWNRKKNSHSRAKAPEKDQNHNSRQDQADTPFANDS